MKIHIAYDKDNDIVMIGNTFDELKSNIIKELMKEWPVSDKIKITIEDDVITSEYFNDMTIYWMYHCKELPELCAR